MKQSAVYILFLFFLGISFQSHAQFISITAIEIGSTSQAGESKLPDVSSFISDTRNPSLFRTSINSELKRSGTYTKEGFRIDFIFKLKKNPSHQFVAGIETVDLTSDLFSVSGSIQDTLFVSSSYKTRNEYFFLKTGYNYVFRPEKRFSIITGGILNFGIPISSRTEELITFDEFGTDQFIFFGKQSASAGLAIPIGIRFKLFRNVSLSLLVKQSFQYYRMDGTPVLTSMIGTNLGLHFKLRD